MLCDPRDLRIHIGQLASGFSARNTRAVSTARDAYDAWGKSMAHTGTTAQPYQFVGQLGYYTHWQDENLTLLQLGVRFYDPQVGRFGQRDNLEPDGRQNAYAYVEGNPQTLVDPQGLKAGPRPRPRPECRGTDRHRPPTCPAGQTPVFLTCFTGAGTGGTWGNAAVYCTREQARREGFCCRNYSQPLCPIGTTLNVPGYGEARVGTCGCGQTKDHPSPNNWLDLWASDCKGRTCWVCISLPSECTPGGAPR